jgi:hypothetical protein
VSRVFAVHVERPLRGQTRLFLPLLVSLASLVPLTQPAAVSATCGGEVTKFVEEDSGTFLYSGNRDAIYTYYDLPCIGGVNAQSTFLRMSDDYTHWIETGVELDAAGVAHFWTEDNVNGAHTYDGQGHPAIGAYYSFMIKYTGCAGCFAAYWAPGSNPDTASWNFLANFATMPRSSGQPESEEAHHDASSGDKYTYALNLEFRRTSGSWVLWTSLNCDASQNSMTGWDAHRLSNSSWTNHQNPPDLC